jgi:hypothetical protein
MVVLPQDSAAAALDSALHRKDYVEHHPANFFAGAYVKTVLDPILYL